MFIDLVKKYLVRDRGQSMHQVNSSPSGNINIELKWIRNRIDP